MCEIIIPNSLWSKIGAIYEVESNDQTIKRTGTLVLKANETKTTECLYAPNSVKSIARKLRN